MAKKRKALAPSSSTKKPRYNHPDAPRPKQSHHHTKPKPNKNNTNTTTSKSNQNNVQNPNLNANPIIPFSPHHTILLVGEGDLSFAASLVTYHKCRHLRAAVLEGSREELVGKYPGAGRNVDIVERGLGGLGGDSGDGVDGGSGGGGGGRGGGKEGEGGKQGSGNIIYNFDVTKRSSFVATFAKKGKRQRKGKRDRDRDREMIGVGGDVSNARARVMMKVAEEDREGKKGGQNGKGNGKPSWQWDDEDDDENYEDQEDDDDNHDDSKNTQPPPSKGPPPLPDRILFNFPHTGGLSRNTNRQVRANQSLLVSFFTHAVPALPPGGRIIVTLFEGEPYTLWNIRDLGRHTGLEVETSFRFQWGVYPGYGHVRTLGVVRRGGKGKEMGRLGGSGRGKDVEEDGEEEESGEDDEEDDGEDEAEDGQDGEDKGSGSGDDEDFNGFSDPGSDAEEAQVPIKPPKAPNHPGNEINQPSKTAWRGEDRPARCYVFIRKDDPVAARTEITGGEKANASGKSKKQKQKQGKKGKGKGRRGDDWDSGSDDD